MAVISFLFLLVLCVHFHSDDAFTSPMDRTYPTTLPELLEQSKETDGAIYGNPLLYPECAQCILNEHADNMEFILKNSGIPTPWFWSRETLDATVKHLVLHRRLKVTSFEPPNIKLPWSSSAAYEYGRDQNKLAGHVVRWYHRLGDTANNTHQNLSFHTEHMANDEKLGLMNDKDNYVGNLPAGLHYYHIEKSGSSSLGGTLKVVGGFNRTYLSENVMSHVDCGFTFVREPIARFISGYYTVNRLIFDHNKYGKRPYPIPQKFSFWNITIEPERTLEFVKNLVEYKFEFLVSSPLEHIMSQSSILSIAELDIFFVGKLHKLKDHLKRVIDHCGSRFLSEPEEIMQRMKGFGTNELDKEPDYAHMMDLKDYQQGQLLPAYKAIADSYKAYQSLVEYFRQDFVCFGFEHDWAAFRTKVYGKLKKQMASDLK